MLTLVISHNIALTREERYRLSEGQEVNVVGVSTPVWFEKGNTSEPAHEVFVNYKLTNEKTPSVVKITTDGYEMNMPQKNAEAEAEIKTVPEPLLAALGVNKNFPDAKSLTDVKDGGAEFLQFRQYARSNLVVDGEKTRTPLNIVHCVEIKPIEEVIQTLA